MVIARPIMLWKKVELADKSLLDQYFATVKMRSFSHCFTELMLWQFRYQPEYSFLQNFLCLRFWEHDCAYYAFPLGNGDLLKGISQLATDFFQQHPHLPFTFNWLTQDQQQTLTELFSDYFIITHNLDLSDYIYRINDLIHLPGNLYHDKRNLLNRFKRHQGYQYQPLTPNSLEQLHTHLSLFYASNSTPNLLLERQGVEFIFRHFSQLDYEGAVITLNQQPIAFTLGENITSDTLVIHVEKALRDYPGAYQAINQFFLVDNLRRNPQLVYVNRENDEGVLGLRKAKQSYHPCHYLDKYTAKSYRTYEKREFFLQSRHEPSRAAQQGS
ncbi:MAG: DUF2156 domain-containing protein [Legionellales bacterium]|nr:DUF2156 domain-containing protein [Legionellales bacterium]